MADCPDCGEPVRPAMAECPACGIELTEGEHETEDNPQ